MALFSKVVLTLELLSFEKAKETWDMSEEEKVDFALQRKEVAGRLFKAQRFQMAMERYKKVVELFNYIDSYKAPVEKGPNRGGEASIWLIWRRE